MLGLSRQEQVVPRCIQGLGRRPTSHGASVNMCVQNRPPFNKRSSEVALRDLCRNKTYTPGGHQVTMSVQKEKLEPPQPILIQAGAKTEPEAVKTEPQTVAPVAVEVREGGGVSQEAIDHYEMTLSTKPSVVGMSVLGLLLIGALPFVILISAFDSGNDDAAGLCCFSIITGSVLMLVASTKDSAWRKELKLAKERVIKEAGLEAPAVSKTPSLIVGVFAVLGVMAPSFSFYYSDVLAAVSFLVAGIAAVFALSQEAEANKVLKRNFNLVINQAKEDE